MVAYPRFSAMALARAMCVSTTTERASALRTKTTHPAGRVSVRAGRVISLYLAEDA